MAAE
ncbi:hypothetical protein YPPY95_2955, partial [Yersinia pestis PY-95]|jgi:hypothetical protein